MALGNGGAKKDAKIPDDEFSSFVAVIALKTCSKAQMERAIRMLTQLLDQNEEALAGTIVQFEQKDDELF